MKGILLLSAATATGAILATGAGAQQLQLRAHGGALAAEANADLWSYAGADVGDFEVDYNTGLLVGGAAGAKLGRRLTLEGEIAGRWARFDTAFYEVGTTTYTETYGGDTGSVVVSVMANGWYDAPLSKRLSFYGGGGVGVATNMEADSEGDYDSEFEGRWSLAWQLGAGLRAQVNDWVSVGAGYRYFRAEDIIDGRATDITPAYAFQGDYTDSAVIAELGVAFPRKRPTGPPRRIEGPRRTSTTIEAPRTTTGP